MNWRQFKTTSEGFKGFKGFKPPESPPLKPLKPLKPAEEILEIEEGYNLIKAAFHRVDALRDWSGFRGSLTPAELQTLAELEKRIDSAYDDQQRHTLLAALAEFETFHKERADFIKQGDDHGPAWCSVARELCTVALDCRQPDGCKRIDCEFSTKELNR